MVFIFNYVSEFCLTKLHYFFLLHSLLPNINLESSLSSMLSVSLFVSALNLSSHKQSCFSSSIDVSPLYDNFNLPIL